MEKAKSLDIPKLRLIIEAVLPQIAYAFDMNEMLSLLRIVRTINITESAGCPEVDNVVTMNMGSSGDCVVPINLEKAVVKLHKILFNVDDYTPSNAVKRYSNRINELRAKYNEENKVNESLKESLKLESMDETNSESNSTNKPRSNISSPSNTKSITPIPISAPNNLNIVDADSYPEEPEEDNNKEPHNTSNNETTAVQQAPGSSDYTVYDAPGVPRQNSGTAPSQDNSPGGGNAPGTSNNSNNGGGVVVSGPPGSVITETTTIARPNTVEETGSVVPILGPPQ